MRFQPSLPSGRRMGTGGSAGGCEEGMGCEGPPGQLRARAMRSPSAGDGNFIHPQLSQTSRQTLRATRRPGRTPSCRNPPPCVPPTQAARETEPSAVKAARGRSWEATALLRGPFPRQRSTLILAHHVNEPTPPAQGRAPMKTIAKANSPVELEGSRQTAPAWPPGTTPAWMLRVTHGWKRREGDHVQVRKSTGCERLVAARHATKKNLFHTLRSALCPCRHGTERGPVPCALSPEPVGSGAAGAAPWSRCRAPGRSPSEHRSERRSVPSPDGKACEGKGKALRETAESGSQLRSITTHFWRRKRPNPPQVPSSHCPNPYAAQLKPGRVTVLSKG